MLTRCLAGFIGAILLFQQCLWASPHDKFKIQHPSERPVSLNIDIPLDLAYIEQVFDAGPNSGLRVILHIQNIHGHVETQKQVKALLDYLKKHYDFDLIFVEGATETLNPEYLNLFQ